MVQIQAEGRELRPFLCASVRARALCAASTPISATPRRSCSTPSSSSASWGSEVPGALQDGAHPRLRSPCRRAHQGVARCYAARLGQDAAGLGLPILGKAAVRLISAPATSASAERANSAYGSTFTAERVSTSRETAAAMVRVRSAESQRQRARGRRLRRRRQRGASAWRGR
jgi:hypothetical protein